MKIIPTYLLAALLLLTGCHNYLDQHDAAMETWRTAMNDAQAQIAMEIPKCTKGKQGEKQSPKEFLKTTECVNDLIEARLLPVTPYPEPLKKMLFVSLENAALYSQGKISFEQVKARRKYDLALLEAEMERLNNEVRQEMANADAEEQVRIGKALQGFQPPRPIYTSCSSFGRTTQCTSQ
ncbi:MAG: hypothetical protein EBR02_05275 [Alphaproteobacteria bacterium]|nr:hypothetical protein [Alphaproteobacteria bacterium]